MAFGANYDVLDEGTYANQKTQFKASTSIGFVVDDGNLDVDGNINIDDLVLSNYNVTQITKYQWDFSDGHFYNSDSVIHKFLTSQRETVSLKVWSEVFQHNGVDFQFTYTVTKFIDVQSRFYKFIIDRFPLWEFIESDAMEDLIRSAGKFFDRMHSDTADLFNLIDLDQIDPNFFEYLSQTLGHDSFYASKVGYDLETNDIEDYDIFNRIQQKEATRAEIDTFRQFLQLSADFFRNKGAPNNVSNILSFMGINATTKDLWTKNWGVTIKGNTSENFLNLNDFEDNRLGLKWENVRAVSINNEDGHFSLLDNSIIIDTYNETQKLEYDADVVGENDEGWVEFELNFDTAKIKDILNHNGKPITNIDSDSTTVPNDPVRYDSTKPEILQVNPSILEQGDRLSVRYEVPRDEELDSFVAVTNNKVKNFDMNFKVTLIPEKTRTNLYRSPSNEIFLVFRGIENLNSDPYAHFQDFYRFGINTEKSTFSFSKMVYNAQLDDYLTQNISLDYDKDDVFEALIIYPDDHIKSGEIFEFKKNTVYEFVVMVNGSMITAAVRENVNETEIQQTVESNLGNDNLFEDEPEEFVSLLTAFDFDVSVKKTKSVDHMGNEIYSEGYTVINDAGNWGIGIRNGILKINEITLENFDLDETLLNKTEKELECKPEYLEFVKRQQLRLDNFKDTKRDFIKIIDNNYDASLSEYNLTNEEANSIELLYLDDANILEDLGTRYNIEFDKNWVANNFENDDDLISKIIIPLGSQYSPVVNESRLYIASTYRDFYGNQEALSGAPGLFAANLSTVLDEYPTVPFDSFSTLNRDNEYSRSFEVSNRFKQFKNLSGQTFTYSGVWEEVTPLSNVFESINPDITLDDTSIFFNELFLPIVVANNDGDKVIGVRFRNCDYISSLINRYGTETNREVMLWGSYKFHLPCASVQHRPNTNHAMKISNKFNGHFEVDVFIPLGVLNTGIQDYKLGLEFVKITNASPSLIELNGIFCKLNTTKAPLSGDKISIFSTNPFESPEKGISCRYYLSSSLDIISGIEKPISNDPNKQHNIFPLSINTRKFLHKLEDTNIYNYENDYNWWVPKEVWRTREYEILEVEENVDILTGINHTKNDNYGKLWFGREVSPSSNNVKSLRIRLLDGNITPNVNYYAKLKINIQYNGFTTEQTNNLSERGRQSLSVSGGESNNYEYQQVPVGTCLEVFMPIAWYPNGDSNEIEWANFIQGSFENNNSISFTPIGLMTQLLNDNPRVNINVLNAQEELQRFVTFTPKWDLADYNQYFLENIEIEYIAEEIPDEYVTLFNKYSILSTEEVNIGAFIDIKFDNTSDDIDWAVNDTFRYFVKNHVNDNVIFDIPRDFISLEDWVKKVSDVTLNRYVIPSSFYNILGNKLKIESGTILENVEKGNLIGKFLYDLYFNENGRTKEAIDNFYDKREISYIPYESDSKEIYEIQNRIPSENLMFGVGQQDQSFDIINVADKGKVFKSLNRNSLYPFTGRQSGTRINDRKINIQENEPHARRIYMVNENNFVFDIEAEVYFDPILNEIKNYRGKKFEIILNARETINPNSKKAILDSYYFAGIGSFDFDCALGVSKYNEKEDSVGQSFLAGFGEFNTKNIKVGTWYKIRCIVTNDYIRVLFNESKEEERLVMNYFINKEYQQDTNRYIDGDFENLNYVLYGLENLNINYPATAGDATNEKFIRRNFNDNIIKNTRPNGSLCGFRIFNEYTYMTNVRYKYLAEGDVQFGKVFDTTNLSDIMIEINKKYGNN